MKRAEVGFGCWQIGGPMRTVDGRVNGYPAADEHAAIAALRHAFDRGIRFFDTAAAYGRGRSEELLGRAFAGEPDPPLICSKFGFKEDDRRAFADFSVSHMRKSLEETLARLGRDHLDILLLHNPPDEFDWAGFDPEPYDQLVRNGRISAYGVSARSLRGAERVLAAGFGSVIEAVFNPLDRRAADGLLGRCGARGVRFIARVPLASGFLTRRGLGRGIVFPEDDIRSTFDAGMARWLCAKAHRLAFLDALEGGIETSAIRFGLSHPGVCFVIPGMRTVAQVDAALAAQRLGPLTAQTLERIAASVPEVYAGWR